MEIYLSENVSSSGFGSYRRKAQGQVSRRSIHSWKTESARPRKDTLNAVRHDVAPLYALISRGSTTPFTAAEMFESDNGKEAQCKLYGHLLG
jgi:hypothetical protein